MNQKKIFWGALDEHPDVKLEAEEDESQKQKVCDGLVHIRMHAQIHSGALCICVRIPSYCLVHNHSSVLLCKKQGLIKGMYVAISFQSAEKEGQTSRRAGCSARGQSAGQCPVT